MSTKEHEESVPLRIRKKWKENQFIPDFFLPAFHTIDNQYPQVIIKDAHNVILAIRITLPVEFLNTLCSTNELLPTKGSTSGQRGTYSTRHYALWADRGTCPYMSSEFRDDGLYAREWVDCNMALYKYLGLFYSILFFIFTLVYVANEYYRRSIKGIRQ